MVPQNTLWEAADIPLVESTVCQQHKPYHATKYRPSQEGMR